VVESAVPQGMSQKTFTLNEARSMLPRLRSLLSLIRDERTLLVNLQPHINKARERVESNGGSPYGALYIERAFKFTEALELIEQTGVIVKDFRVGLIDFPYEYDGRIVYLCWKPDEDELTWWHEVDDGFAGRQPIEGTFEKLH
jgi:hypothetical protein